jgi:hypothetical protein
MEQNRYQPPEKAFSSLFQQAIVKTYTDLPAEDRKLVDRAVKKINSGLRLGGLGTISGLEVVAKIALYLAGQEIPRSPQDIKPK